MQIEGYLAFPDRSEPALPTRAPSTPDSSRYHEHRPEFVLELPMSTQPDAATPPTDDVRLAAPLPLQYGRQPHPIPAVENATRPPAGHAVATWRQAQRVLHGNVPNHDGSIDTGTAVPTAGRRHPIPLVERGATGAIAGHAGHGYR